MKKDKIKSDFLSAVSAYNTVLSLDHPGLGLIFFLSTFLHPNIGISGFIALAISILFLNLLGTHVAHRFRGMYCYNSLLVGLIIGYLFELDLTVLFLIICASCLTLLLTIFLESVFRTFYLPILSLPFMLVGGCLALGSQNFSNLSDAVPYFLNHTVFLNSYFPLASTFFRSLSTAFCTPDPIVGLIVFVSILAVSPMTALFLCLGFFEGFLVESCFSLREVDPSRNFHYFNYSLIFCTLAGVFLVPSRASLFIASIGTLLGTLVASSALAFWGSFHIPILSLPYNTLVILIIRALLTVGPEKLNSVFGGTPERTLDLAHLQKLRFGNFQPGLFSPLEGESTVLQGFDGPWTHQGNWRHALDFAISNQEGKSFLNQGFELSDYFIFGKPVVSPIEGYVIHLQTDFPDLPIGKVDNQNNWGNYILVKSIYGYYVLLSHLQFQSVTVKTGDYVRVGQPLAKCGNSGYSPEPHLHLQVQMTPELGAYTIPFCLLNFVRNNQLFFHGIPIAKDRIHPIQLNRALEPKLVFKIGYTIPLQFSVSGKKIKQVQLSHHLDPVLGKYYWFDGTSRLYYDRIGHTFYFYGLKGTRPSPIWDLYLSAPKLPMTFGNSFSFYDALPLQISDKKLNQWIKLFRKLFLNSNIHILGSYTMNPSALEINGTVQFKNVEKSTFIKLDPVLGIQEFRVGERSYVRI